MNKKVHNLTHIALLAAILVVMAITPLGYITLGPLSITFLTIPVIVGALCFGPGAGAVLGLAFGLTSFFRASQSPMMSYFLSVNPFYTFVLAVVPRVLEGFLCGTIYRLLNRKKELKLWKISISSLSCPVLNTILYIGTMILLFGRTEYVQKLQGGRSLLTFVVALVGIQAVVEAAVCGMVGSIVCAALIKTLYSGKNI